MNISAINTKTSFGRGKMTVVTPEGRTYDFDKDEKKQSEIIKKTTGWDREKDDMGRWSNAAIALDFFTQDSEALETLEMMKPNQTIELHLSPAARNMSLSKFYPAVVPVFREDSKKGRDTDFSAYIHTHVYNGEYGGNTYDRLQKEFLEPIRQRLNLKG